MGVPQFDLSAVTLWIILTKPYSQWTPTKRNYLINELMTICHHASIWHHASTGVAVFPSVAGYHMNTAQGGCLPACLLACLLTCCTTVRGSVFCNCKSRSGATRLLSQSPLSLHLQLLHMNAPPGHSSRAVGAVRWGQGLACRRRKRSCCDESSR
jgi:hypothetical protein